MKVGVGLVVLAACAAPSHPPLAAPRVVMRDAGAEPRHLLRYQFTAGQVAHCEMDLQTTAKLAVAGGLISPEAPTLRARVDATVDEVAPDGSARISTRVVAARVLDDGNADPRARAYLAKAAEALVGGRTTRHVSGRGEVSEASAVPANVEKTPAPDLGWQLDRGLVVLPVEPIGTGARWDNEYQRAMGSANMTIREHVHVVAAHAADAQIETDFMMSAPVQLLDRDLVLSKVSGEGHATLAWTAGDLCAASAATVAINFTLDRGRQRGNARLEVRSATRRLPP